MSFQITTCKRSRLSDMLTGRPISFAKLGKSTKTTISGAVLQSMLLISLIIPSLEDGSRRRSLALMQYSPDLGVTGPSPSALQARVRRSLLSRNFDRGDNLQNHPAELD